MNDLITQFLRINLKLIREHKGQTLSQLTVATAERDRAQRDVDQARATIAGDEALIAAIESELASEVRS